MRLRTSLNPRQKNQTNRPSNMESSNLSGKFSSLTGNVKEYIRLRIELLKLTAAEGLIQALSYLMLTIVLFLLGMFLLFFLSLAFIYWFGQHAGPMYVGALIVVVVYLAAFILVYIYRKKLFIDPLVHAGLSKPADYHCRTGDRHQPGRSAGIHSAKTGRAQAI